jgi:hypothetical protein
VRKEAVILVRFPDITDTGVVCDKPFANPEPVGASHLYKVPEGTSPSCVSFGETEKGEPEHTDVLREFIVAIGLTVTVTVNVLPVQPK